MKDRTYYHKKYYRVRSLKKLRARVKSLESTLQMFKNSPEGEAYFKRKNKEYQKEYREKNLERIQEYRKNYATL
tara:strand:+ start:3002 stop:3223 length:222 start_codon:yes stop_codon:yes gene_type:complete